MTIPKGSPGPRFALIVLAAAFVVAGAQYGAAALAGVPEGSPNLRALAVALSLFVLAGAAVGWLAHGLLTDAIIARCKAITEHAVVQAGAHVKRAEDERDAAVAAMGRAVEREREARGS